MEGEGHTWCEVLLAVKLPMNSYLISVDRSGDQPVPTLDRQSIASQTTATRLDFTNGSEAWRKTLS